MKPSTKPANPCFSSGPCPKFPGYSHLHLRNTPFGRSHRSAIGRSKLRETIQKTRSILGIPSDYGIAIVPASDTGAFELAMWNMLGMRGVDVFAWESFGNRWVTDITKHLKLENVRVFRTDYGKITDLGQADFNNDIVFVWNGTSSGVRVPDGNWIDGSRRGLTFCDATSAVFAQDLPWEKLDIVTFSWQKVLGSEGGHGMLVLSSRAVERLEEYTPSWPIPYIFRIRKNDRIMEEIFDGSTINTPSMLANEDYLAALKWAESIGGLPELFRRANDNLAVFERFVEKHEWIDFLAERQDTRSNTSICLTLDLEADKLERLATIFTEEKVAFDCASYREAPLGLRFWAGATVMTADIEALCPWLEWGYEHVR
jgi:phosphoserine aminotransferase